MSLQLRDNVHPQNHVTNIELVGTLKGTVQGDDPAILRQIVLVHFDILYTTSSGSKKKILPFYKSSGTSESVHKADIYFPFSGILYIPNRDTEWLVKPMETLSYTFQEHYESAILPYITDRNRGKCHVDAFLKSIQVPYKDRNPSHRCMYTHSATVLDGCGGSLVLADAAMYITETLKEDLGEEEKMLNYFQVNQHIGTNNVFGIRLDNIRTLDRVHRTSMFHTYLRAIYGTLFLRETVLSQLVPSHFSHSKVQEKLVKFKKSHTFNLWYNGKKVVVPNERGLEQFFPFGPFKQNTLQSTLPTPFDLLYHFRIFTLNC